MAYGFHSSWSIQRPSLPVHTSVNVLFLGTSLGLATGTEIGKNAAAPAPTRPAWMKARLLSRLGLLFSGILCSFAFVLMLYALDLTGPWLPSIACPAHSALVVVIYYLFSWVY